MKSCAVYPGVVWIVWSQEEHLALYGSRKHPLALCMCFCTGYRPLGRSPFKRSHPPPPQPTRSHWLHYDKPSSCLFFPFLRVFFVFVVFLHMHEVLGISLVWPNVVYLNFMSNDLVTCTTKWWRQHILILLHMLMLSLNNSRGNIFLYSKYRQI